MDADATPTSPKCWVELEHLVEVVQELSLARDMDRIGEIVRHEAHELVGADGATLVLREGDNSFYADEEAIGPLWKGLRFPLDRSVSGWVMTHGEPAPIEDVRADARFAAEAGQPTFVRSMLMVPVGRTEPVGAIGSYWGYTHRPTDEETRLLRALANTTAVAIENVRLRSELEQRVKERTEALEHEIAERRRAEEAVRQLAISDEQTGLLNRRGFFLQAAQQWKTAQRAGQQGLLLFVDIDGLKRVNDAHGHEAGDRMIADAAEMLRRVFRRSDVIARIGGDEFVIFTLDAQDPTAVRQRLRRAVDAFNDDALRPWRLSLSVGLSGRSPGAPASLDHMLEEADAAMYYEKRTKVVSRAFAS